MNRVIVIDMNIRIHVCIKVLYHCLFVLHIVLYYCVCCLSLVKNLGDSVVSNEASEVSNGHSELSNDVRKL